jgi:DNA-directed RNA polymerase specialized sigma24 family protein
MRISFLIRKQPIRAYSNAPQIKEDTVSAIVQAMRLLEEAQRRAVRLFYVDGLPVEEVCRQTSLDIEEFRRIRCDLRELWRAVSNLAEHGAEEAGLAVSARRSLRRVV